MATDHPSAIVGHPIHNLLSAFPIAFFTGAFVTDIVYANTAQMMWANFSIWLITGGLIMGGLAAIAGTVDFAARKHAAARRRGWPHTIGTALVMVLSLINAFVHSRDAWTSVVPAGIILSGIVAILVLVTSWMGASLVYRANVGAA